MAGILNPTSPHGWSAWDYANRILELLGDVVEAVTEKSTSTGQTIRRRHPFVIATDAAGNGQATAMLPAGVHWTLLSWAFQTPGPVSGYVAFYQDSEEGTSLLVSEPLNAVASGQFSPEGDVIAEQSGLLIVVRGGPANSTVSGNVKCKGETNAVPRKTPGGGEF